MDELTKERAAHELRSERDRLDLEMINRNAGRLNREALDVLNYQPLLFPSKSRFCSQ
jgi:hypothetical protein